VDKESQKVVSSLKETFHKLDSLYDVYAKSVGLNFITILVLQLLDDSLQVYTQKDVCEKLDLPKQLVNSIIKSLWEQGYVQLKEAKDRRNKDIIVTDKGRVYILNILKPLTDAESAAWEGFGAGEILQCANTMEKYARAFEHVLQETQKAIPAALIR